MPSNLAWVFAGNHFAKDFDASSAPPPMSDWLVDNINVTWWFLVLLSIGILDTLIQLLDYLRWRKERHKSDD